MIKAFTLALAVFSLGAPPAAMAAAHVYKCKVNGSLQYQQSPCPSSEAIKRPSLEELNAARQVESADEKKAPRAPYQAPAMPSVFQPEPSQAVRGNAQGAPGATFKCDGRKRCPQMTSCAEAKYFLRHCQDVEMDGDRDGIPCEEQWCGH